ncbi:MAG TPA: hypothetical protein VGK19_00450 [Capsulimonadaceae bacterium]|jgi:hypothetical protein
MKTESQELQTQFKLGSSPFWLEFHQEEFGLSRGWRVGVRHVPPRARKKQNGLPLLEVTPRKPILSIILDDETYPLFINEWQKKRGNNFVLRGSRPIGSKATIANWSAELSVSNVRGAVKLDFAFRLSIDGRHSTPLRVRFCLPLNMSNPMMATSEVASIRDDRALIAWDPATKNAVAFVPPMEALLTDIWTPNNEFVAYFTESIVGSKKPVDISLTIGEAATGRKVKELLLEHYASTRPVMLPPAYDWSLTLCQTAAQAVVTHTDKGAYDVRGVERAYFLPPGEFETGPSRAPEYFAGYPYFQVDASDALLAWNRFFGTDTVSQVAKLTARGIAADFPNSAAMGYGENNKSAFWDKFSSPIGSRTGQFSGFDDQPAFSVLTNARIARSLFSIYAQTKEDLFATMALNTCRWLMLRQNVSGYFGGDRYTNSGEWQGGMSLAGVEVIPAFVEAFRVTKNEVFIRAAWRIANHVIDEILPHHPCPPMLPMERGAPIDSAVALASVIRCLLYLDAEAPNKRLREAIHMVGNRFACYPFNRTRDPELNYDEQWGGLYECVQSAFWLYNLERNVKHLNLGMSLLRSIPPCARRSWRAIPGYASAMLTLAALVKDAKVDQINSTVKMGWRVFDADPAARQYIQVNATDEATLVDHFSLVCKGDDTVLVMVLSDTPIDAVNIVKNNRNPVVRDLVTGVLVSGSVPVHKLPYQSQARFGVYSISK